MREREYYLRSDLVRYEAALRLAVARNDQPAVTRLKKVIAGIRSQLD